MSNIQFSTRLQQAVAQHTPPPAPRRLPTWAWPALAAVIMALALVALLAVALNPPTRRSAPPNVTPAIINPQIGAAPASTGARPQEVATAPPMETATTPAALEAVPPTYVYRGARGRPVPTAAPVGIYGIPMPGTWKMMYPPREGSK